MHHKMLITITRLGLLVVIGVVVWACLNKIPSTLYFSKSDLVLHFSGFLGLGLLAAFAYPNSSGLKVLLAIVFFSVLLETMQPILTKGRELSLSDIIMNSLGGIIGFLIGSVIICILSNIFKR